MHKKIKIMEILINEGGFSIKEASAICGIIDSESKYNEKDYNLIGNTAQYNGGLLHWHNKAFRRLLKYSEKRGKIWTDLKVQIDFIIEEFNTFKIDKDTYLIDKMRENKEINIDDLVSIIANDYLELEFRTINLRDKQIKAKKIYEIFFKRKMMLM